MAYYAKRATKELFNCPYVSVYKTARTVVVSLHGCVLGILEGVARLLEGAEGGEELSERVRTVRDAVSSLPHPAENLPPSYDPSR